MEVACTKPPSSMEGGLRVDLAMVLACPRHCPGQVPGLRRFSRRRASAGSWYSVGSLGRLPERSKARPCSAGCERTGQSVGVKRRVGPSEEAKPVAEPSPRGDGGAGGHRGGAPQRPLEADRRPVQPLRERDAADQAAVGGDGRWVRHVAAGGTTEGPGDRSPGPSVRLRTSRPRLVSASAPPALGHGGRRRWRSAGSDRSRRP